MQAQVVTSFLGMTSRSLAEHGYKQQVEVAIAREMLAEATLDSCDPC